MPYDSRTDDLLTQIQQEGSLTRSQARRVLIEQIDLAKRERLLDPVRAGLEINPTHDGGVAFKRNNLIVKTENPHRQLVATSPAAERAKARATRTRETSTDFHQLRAERERHARLDAENALKDENISIGTRDRTVSTDSHTGKLNGKKLTDRQPIPGSLTAMVVGALRDPELDFNQVFITLRSRKQLEHLTDDKLRQRIRETAWRYDLPIWYHAATLPDSSVSTIEETEGGEINDTGNSEVSGIETDAVG